VIELRVNEVRLFAACRTRVAEIGRVGEEVRIDDTQELLTKRPGELSHAALEPLIVTTIRSAQLLRSRA